MGKRTTISIKTEILPAAEKARLQYSKIAGYIPSKQKFLELLIERGIKSLPFSPDKS